MAKPKINKNDPPGTRIVGGKKVVPYQKPPKVTKPIGRAGNYAAPVDTTGMDAEMIGTLGIKRKKGR
jgi:hypothetical protein